MMGISKDCTGCRSFAGEPEIWPENSEAFQVFLICHRQMRAGFSGAYAIDGNFVWRVLEDRGAGNKTELFSRVDTLAACYLDALPKPKQPKKPKQP